MLRKIVGIALIILALGCIGTTVYELVAAKGEVSIWSASVIGAVVFHGICMTIAMLLLSPKSMKATDERKV